MPEEFNCPTDCPNRREKQLLPPPPRIKKCGWCDRYNAMPEGCYRRWRFGSQAVFLAGWMNRLNALRRELNSKNPM